MSSVTFNGSCLNVVRNISTHICAINIFEIVFPKNVLFRLFFYIYERKTPAMAETDERDVFTIPTTSEKTEDGETYVVTNSIILSFTKMNLFVR